MNLETMVNLLNLDLKNEWKHLGFYLHHASTVSGLHRNEYREFFLEAAASEMKHVSAFSEAILGIGGTPTSVSNEFPTMMPPRDILEYALEMETEVVANYTRRIKQAQLLGEKGFPEDGQWLEIFLEGQLGDSRSDADHLKQIIRGI